MSFVLSRSSLPLALLVGGLALPACGLPVIERPESLELTSYPAGRAFRMTLVMRACADGCATYEDADCSVSVDEDAKRVDADASVAYSREDGAPCNLACGPAVLAHCDVPALTAGTWTVRDGDFERRIEVR